MIYSNNKKIIKISAEDFWHFSCGVYNINRLYHKDKQPYSLLELQNKFNKNVNICLLMLYLDELKVSISQETLNKLILTIADFENSFLLPLILLRLRLKKTDISLYSKMRKMLLDAELSMEKHQQSQLINTINNCEITPTQSIENLYAYLHFDVK